MREAPQRVTPGVLKAIAIIVGPPIDRNTCAAMAQCCVHNVVSFEHSGALKAMTVLMHCWLPRVC